MALARTTAVAVLNYARARLGKSRVNGADWTPSRTEDDCALFTSSVLWGGDPGPIAWVDNYKTAHDGTYHPGKAGMQPGDVVLFDWDGNGVGNHVEFCLTAPSQSGAFTTIGANGSDTIAVGIRNRNGYVLGYFRPAYGASITTASDGSPIVLDSATLTKAAAIIDSIQEDEMRSFHIIGPKGSQELAVYVPAHGLVGPTSADFQAAVNKAFDSKTVEINTNDAYAIQQLNKGLGK